MKLRILGGPSTQEVSDVFNGSMIKKGVKLVFEVKPLKLHLAIPDITVKPSRIDSKGKGKDMFFRIRGKSIEGDKCKIKYRPNRGKPKGKGVMSLTE